MFQYVIADTIGTRKVWGTLDAVGVSFNDPVSATGSLSGTLSLSSPGANGYTSLRQLIETSRAAIYVVDPSSNAILWPGHILSYKWNRLEHSLEIEARQASGWLDERCIATGTGVWSRTNKDRFQIAKDLVSYATSHAGAPRIVLPAGLSGKLGTVSLEAQSATTVLSALDALSQTDDHKFDWSIQARHNPQDSYPELYLALWMPERTSGATFDLYSTPFGSNIVLNDWEVDVSAQRSRVIGYGDGSPPAKKTYTATDPAVAAGTRMLREKAVNFSDEVVQANLQKRVTDELTGIQSKTGTVTVDLVPGGVPPVSQYLSGDRVSLRVLDDFVDVDYDSVRITDRTIQDEDRENVAKVSLVLDLNDYDSGET